jgi:hypothetical protein
LSALQEEHNKTLVDGNVGAISPLDPVATAKVWLTRDLSGFCSA